MNNGFIKIQRKIWDNPISNKPNYLSIWIYLLSHANFKDKYIIIDNKKTLIKRGTFIGSLLGISKRFKISIGSVSKILKYLESETQIETKRTNKYTIFTIINYDKYNEVETKDENKVKTKRKQNETTNKDKNVKNEKKREISPSQLMKNFLISIENKTYSLFLKETLNIEVNQEKKEIENFASYWSELNPSGTKQKWEIEKTFELKRRLQKWFNNKLKWEK